MTLVPFTDCCLQLGIDPKTLRCWLKTAHLSACLHPADARVKCLTRDQLSRLAALHDRRLLLPADQTPAPFPAAPVPPVLATGSPSVGAPSEIAELRHQFTLLQTQVATLQAQVTELALALLRAPGFSSQASASVPAGRSAPAPSASPRPAASSSPPPQTRSRALPLIEIRPDGTPLVISPTQGVLPLVPDSPEWFAWLSSLTSFTFRGQHGHFSADRRQRNGHLIQFWGARRCHHGRPCHLYLGATEHVTLARLEEMASLMATRLALS